LPTSKSFKSCLQIPDNNIYTMKKDLFDDEFLKEFKSGEELGIF
jgi:hypothetical protein